MGSRYTNLFDGPGYSHYRGIEVPTLTDGVVSDNWATVTAGEEVRVVEDDWITVVASDDAGGTREDAAVWVALLWIGNCLATNSAIFAKSSWDNGRGCRSPADVEVLCL